MTGQHGCLITALDHIIFCGRDREAWRHRIETVLALTPSRGRDADEWLFANYEFDIGAGFLGLVSPAGEGSRLEAFLARNGDAYYAVSVAVRSMAETAAYWDTIGLRYDTAYRDGVPGLLWPHPRETAGVLFQVYGGTPPAAGSNPNLAGLSAVTLRVADVDAAAAALERAFGLPWAGRPPGRRTGDGATALPIPGAPLGAAIRLTGHGRAAAAPRTGDRTVIEQWTIAVHDLGAEARRLTAAGVEVQRDGSGLLRLSPDALGALRVELGAR